MEFIRAQRSTRLSNRHHLGMCRRILVRRHPVHTLADDLAVPHNHGTEWPSARTHVLLGQRNRTP